MKHQIIIRVSPEEKATIRAAARASGVYTMAGWLRQKAREAARKELAEAKRAA